MGFWSDAWDSFTDFIEHPIDTVRDWLSNEEEELPEPEETAEEAGDEWEEIRDDWYGELEDAGLDPDERDAIFTEEMHDMWENGEIDREDLLDAIQDYIDEFDIPYEDIHEIYEECFYGE